MKCCKPGTLTNCFKPRASSSCASSSSQSSFTLTLPIPSRNVPPLYLPFLYPAQSIRFASVSATEKGADVKEKGATVAKDDPWSFLYGTSEADKLPAPMASHFNRSRSPYSQPEGDDSSRLPVYSKLSSFQLRRRETIPTTITQREREIFARIFESILSEAPSSGSKGADFKKAGGKLPSPSLTALFESAVGPQFNRDQLTFGPRTSTADPRSVSAAMARASAMADYPPSLRAAAAQAAGLKKYAMTEQELKEEGIRQTELVGLLSKMAACQTDLELTDFMDQHVFSMVTNSADLNAPNPPPRRPGRSPKNSVKVNNKRYVFPSASYADLLLEGMRLLHKAFRDLSGTIAIFERIKRLGAESYVIGCTVGVYNQILEAKWESYRDIFKIEALLEEMQVNGIQGDAGTVEVLRKISLEALRMTDIRHLGAGCALLTEAEKESLVKVDSEADQLIEMIKNKMRAIGRAEDRRLGLGQALMKPKPPTAKELLAQL